MPSITHQHGLYGPHVVASGKDFQAIASWSLRHRLWEFTGNPSKINLYFFTKIYPI